MPDARADLLQGTLDLLVLQTVQQAPLHGWAISKRIRERSADVLDVNQGSLYPALYRLEARGLITFEWQATENGRKAKVYSLTRAGRKQLEVETSDWERRASAVARLLRIEA